MSAISWNTVKDALHAWFVAGSGLDPTRVLFAMGQNPPRPDGSAAWISLRFQGFSSYGRDWTVYEDNPSPSPGAELLARTRGLRRIQYTATIFPPVGASDATEANAICGDVVAELGQPKRRSALSSAGVGLLKHDPALILDKVMNTTRFEPRVALPFAFLVPSEVTATETFIEIVNVEVQTTDPARDFTFSIDLEP